MDELIYPRQQALQNPETVATVIHAILLEKYGEEVYDWDPVTIFLEIKDDFRCDVADEVMDKWSALAVVMANDGFFKRLDAFLNVCNTLNDGSPFFGVFHPVTVEEAAWAIAEVALNRELLPFSYPVKQYLRTILAQDGYDKDTYPAIFEEVFGPQPNADRVRAGLAVAQNDENIGQFITEQMRDLCYQFDKIPDLKGVDDLILQRGLEEALAETTNKQEENVNGTGAENANHSQGN